MSIDAIQGAGRSSMMQNMQKLQSEQRDDSFAMRISAAIEQVDQIQHGADDKLGELAAGQSVDIHGTMIALEEAEIAIRTMASVRDKVVQAYETIMNMQI